MINLRCKNPELPLSALGQERTSGGQAPMSALPLKADIAECHWDVRLRLAIKYLTVPNNWDARAR
jgi:hypothetical protein